MKDYLFFIDGLNREVWKAGINQKEALRAAWQELSEDDKNCVRCFDMIDTREHVFTAEEIGNKLFALETNLQTLQSKMARTGMLMITADSETLDACLRSVEFLKEVKFALEKINV